MNYFLRLLEIPKTGCLLGASVDTVVLVTINLKMNSFRDSSVFSKAKVRPATSPFYYKFTVVYRKSVNWLYYRCIAAVSINLLVVYRESVNLIGYITRRLSADSLQL